MLTQDPTGNPDSDAQQIHVKLKKRISQQMIRQLQQKEFKGILGKVQKHKEKLSHLYLIDKEGILRRVVRENNLKLEVIVVPRDLTKILLFEIHEALAHPGQLKMYMFIRRCYFWKNMRTDVKAFVRNCSACNRACLKEPKYVDSTNVIPRFPMVNIAIDLMEPFLPTTQGNERILSCMDLLTHYIFLVPIPDKQAEMVIKAYTEHIYSEAGGSHSILSDRGSEFTAQTFKQVVEELGLKQVFTSPRTPTTNAVLERAHSFVKNKLTRIRAAVPGVEWDEVLPHVRFAYNIVPSSVTEEAPFYLFHGRDPYLPKLQDLLGYKIRYMGDEKQGLLIDAMYILYQEMMAQLIQARQNMNLDIPILRGDLFSVGDIVLFKDHGKEKLAPQYNEMYQVLRQLGDKTVDIMNNRGEVRRATFPQLKKVTPMEALIMKIPINVRYGRQAKYLKSTLPEALREVTGDLSGKRTATKPNPSGINSLK